MAKTEQYRSMLENLEEEKRNLESLREYFAQGVPEGYEIDEMRDAANEARRLRASAYARSPELSELSRFFTRDTDFAEIDAMFRTEARRVAAIAERDAIQARINTAEESAVGEFGGNAPDPYEIEKHARTLTKRGSVSMIIALLTCVVPVILLGALVSPWLYALAIPLAVVGIIAGTKRASECGAASTYAKGLGIRGDDIPGKLMALADRLRDGDASVRENKQKVAVLDRSIIEDTERVNTYVGSYPHGAATVNEALEVISDSYKRYYSLKQVERESLTDREGVELKIRELESRVAAFLAKYKTVGENPFEEIRVKLNAYNFGKMTVERNTAECQTYARLHGIDPDEVIAKTASHGVDIDVLLRENSDRIAEARREHTILERTYDECQSECDRADEVRAVREGYVERLERCNESLEVIRCAEAMLTEACENMTSKYIGGTEERFIKYESLIGEDVGGYAIDTDFVITKNDRGATRQMESYSRGTRDLHAFALRMALIDSLYEGNCPLIILDDPFASFDDKRLVGAKEMIKSLAKEKQVLYFTCTRERAI